MAAAGPVILFVILLLAQVMACGVVASYAAHCFLVVVEDTSAGVDKITWPNEVYVDWIWKPVYLAWLTAVWLVPAELILPTVDLPVLAGNEALGFLIVATVSVWLFFPISLLSSLSAHSRWTPFRIAIVRGLARRPALVVVFYAASGMLLAIGAACIYLAQIRGSTPFVLMAGATGAAGLLIYARLLGRLAWVLRGVRPPEVKPIRSKGRRRRTAPYPEATDPWAVPADELNKRMREQGPVVSVPLDGPVDPYAVASDASPSSTERGAKPARSAALDGPAESYDLAAEASPTEEEVHGSRPVLDEPSAEEMELARLSREPPPPRLLLVTGVYTFPWYSATLPAWILLSLGLMALQSLLLLQRQYWPGN